MKNALLDRATTRHRSQLASCLDSRLKSTNVHRPNFLKSSFSSSWELNHRLCAGLHVSGHMIYVVFTVPLRLHSSPSSVPSRFYRSISGTRSSHTLVITRDYRAITSVPQATFLSPLLFFTNKQTYFWRNSDVRLLLDGGPHPVRCHKEVSNYLIQILHPTSRVLSW